MSIKIPNGRKELPKKLQDEQVQKIKTFLKILAGLIYAPHNSPEDDREMERIVAEYSAELFKEEKRKSAQVRLLSQIQTTLEIEKEVEGRSVLEEEND